jgi:transketolase
MFLHALRLPKGRQGPTHVPADHVCAFRMTKSLRVPEAGSDNIYKASLKVS